MEALNDMRSLAIYHASQTVLPNLHQVVRHTLAVVDNLRSQLSKATTPKPSNPAPYTPNPAP